MQRILISLIRAYQYLLSPQFPPTCRFAPSCSCYACEAIAKYGVLRGGWLSAKRITRCGPWNPGGHDPVP